jgi:hypothetical protein
MRTDITAMMILVLLLNACSTIPPLPAADNAVTRCLQIYREADGTLAGTGMIPSRPAPVAGFSYLRVDRFLASYRDQKMDQAALSVWLERMAEYARAARKIALTALPENDYAHLAGTLRGDPEQLLTDCAHTLVHYDLMHPDRIAALRNNAVVPSEYLTFNQILGLYPLTAIPISVGVRNYHRETHDTFEQPLSELVTDGKLQRFIPPAPALQPGVINLERDVLGIPAPPPQQLQILFARYAPVWEIDVAGRYDLPGIPVRDANGTPDVDTREPVVYRYPSYIRWQDQALLQLNYQIWFSERPRQGNFDILGGALDGLIWRVTLKPDGSVLLYDTIHPCGCYHYFFPGSELVLQQQALTLPEPPLVPQSAPSLQPDERTVIRVASTTHYIQRVYAGHAATGTFYSWRDYGELYATAVNGDVKLRLFAGDGLVQGSERSERWLLWPMGIPSAGAMRERGRHATAFVGRRHFDDADLLNQLFEPAR